MTGESILEPEVLAAVDKHVAAFTALRSQYESFARHVKGVIEYKCQAELIHAATHRAKEIDSFRNKCLKTGSDGRLKYPAPLTEITDLAGVRIIVFTRDAVDAVCKKIEGLFEVREFQDVGDRVYKSGKFGYQSKHMLVRERTEPGPDSSGAASLVCEIQVRTILQHAWAEMEHDIQYKSAFDVPLDLNKRFSALAGLLEIADREFAAIQKDSITLKSVVKEDLVSDLTAQSLESNQGTPVAITDQKALRGVRDYISQGRYAEAIEIYSSNITEQPTAHTLFIGRAKAHFLSGNVRAALADLDESDRLNPSSEEARRLRGIIEIGDTSLLQKTDNKHGEDEALAWALSYLAEGKGIEAFHEYHKFESAGYSRARANLGKAMSCVLENDCDGADRFIGQLEVRGGAMGVNIRAVQGVIAILRNLPPDLEILADALQQSPTFVFAASPLANLRSGVARRLGTKHLATKFLDTIAQLKDADRGGGAKAATP